MKRYIFGSLIICVAISSVGLADMVRQLWSSGTIPGENLTAIRDFHADKRPGMELDPPPDLEDILTESFWSSALPGDPRFTCNMWGWVTVPQTGTYTWHIHADNHAILYVSPDENMENAVEVATISGWSNVGEWNGGANGGTNADSDPFIYNAGQQLAVWGIMVEGTGGDNMGIGWTLPGAAAISYITDHVSINPPTPTRAKVVAPALDEGDILRDPLLQWEAGEFANTHNVYLSTSFTDVNDGAAGALVVEGHADTSYAPGRLQFGETYYWRVDEVNAAPDFTVYEGKVWSFTIEPEFLAIENVSAAASSTFGVSTADKAVDGSGLTDDLHGSNAADMWISGGIPATIDFTFDRLYKLQEMWVWNSNQLIEAFVGFGAKDVVIEYSTDGANWTVLEGTTSLTQAPGTDGYAHNNVVDFGGAMAQQVRITVNSVHGIAPQASLSEVRFYYIPVNARDPIPADGGTADAVVTTLGWRPGREAGSHEVRLSRDQAAITDGTAAAVETSESSYSPDPLIYSGTYYWQVTEINAVGTPPSHAGPVWSFMAPSYLSVDDFEFYADEEFREIWATWIDGFDDPGNGAIVGNGNDPETSIISEGSRSMPIHYDNTASAISAATRTFDPVLNWTTGEPTSLTMDIRGNAADFTEDADGNITISGAGADIWNTADEFRFAYKSLSGDGSITARVHSHTVVHDWSKVGVMIRETATPESAMFMLPTTGVNGVRPQGRTSTFVAAENMPGGLDGVQETIARDQAVWLRIERSGNNFSGWYSTEETVVNWTPLPGNPWTINMAANTLIGLAITSHSSGNTVVAQISDVSTTGNVGGGWTVEAIGVDQPSNDGDAIYATISDRSGRSATVSYLGGDMTATLGTVFEQWIIPLADLAPVSLNSIESISIGVGTPGGTPSGAQGSVYVDRVQIGTPLP